jgi:hypothetical protein
MRLPVTGWGAQICAMVQPWSFQLVMAVTRFVNAGVVAKFLEKIIFVSFHGALSKTTTMMSEENRILAK